MKNHVLALSVFCIVFVSVQSSSAQTVQSFRYDCVTTGQKMTVDANISDAHDDNTVYRWQYKVGTDNWICFEDGVNLINGNNFTVSGARGSGANNAPELNILNSSSALENVLVRVIMAIGDDPCSDPAPSEIWGGDDKLAEETKYLRLHVFPSVGSCPPNAYICPENMLVNSGKFYGGFENTEYDLATASFDRNNFESGSASSDLPFGKGRGHYQDINNPSAMNARFSRNIAPHTGNYQMVIEGSGNPADRVWYKTVSVVAGQQYAFSVWVARVDDSNPLIELRANSSILMSENISAQPIGKWTQVHGTYMATTTGNIVFNVRDGQTGGNNNFVMDDICLRACSNCSILELHQLNLSALLQKDEVKLKWIAENEMGTSNFIIERSFDGLSFDRVGTKAPSGPLNTPTAYFFTDGVHLLGMNNFLYYRIKALDSDGRYAYSNVMIIHLGKENLVQAWPVPFGKYVNVSYNSTGNSRVRVNIMNNMGKSVYQNEYNVSRGLNQVTLSGLDNFHNGFYYIRITDMKSNEVRVCQLYK